MLILSLALWLFGLYTKRSGFEYNKTGLEMYILQFVVISAVLALLSPSRIDNLLYLKDFWLLSSFILASSLIKTKQDIIKVVTMFLIVAAVQSVAAYTQYFLDINYLNAFKFGVDNWRARLPLGRIVMGFLGHHLTFGGYMMMVAFPLFYMAFIKRRDLERIPSWAVRGSAVMAFITIILSWARSVIIAMPFALMPLIVKSRKKFIIASGVIVSIVIFIFFVLGPYGDFSGNIYNNSTIVRFQIWKHAFNVFKKYPIIGSGGSNYKKEFEIDVNESQDIDDEYRSAYEAYNKSKKNLFKIQKQKKSLSGEVVKLMDDLRREELAKTETELQYWGIEDYIPEEDEAYRKVYDKYIYWETFYEGLEKKSRNAEIFYKENKRIYESVKEKYNEAEVLFLKQFPSRVTHAHNDYLNQLARKGIIGLASFLFMLYGIIRYMFDNIRLMDDRFMWYFYMGLFGSVTAFLMASMYQCYYTDDETLVMFWLNVGLLAGIVRASGKDSDK